MLITLVIIGIVAALTIPNLLQKYQEQATVKKVQKFYSNLLNAYSLAVKENGPASDWGLTGADEVSAIKIYELLIKPYFKIAKDCGTTNKGNCINNIGYNNLNNEPYAGYGAGKTGFYKISLDDGAAVLLRSNNSKKAEAFYDVNGKKGPNAWGKDLFNFVISNNKVYPVGLPLYHNLSTEQANTRNQAYCSPTSTSLYNGTECTAWVIYKGNMDYLRKEIEW